MQIAKHLTFCRARFDLLQALHQRTMAYTDATHRMSIAAASHSNCTYNDLKSWVEAERHATREAHTALKDHRRLHGC